MAYPGLAHSVFGPGLALRPLALAVAVLLPFAYALDPPDGDLTRLGGYPENLYAPTAPQGLFVPPLAEAARPGAAYDLVVIGDGFSLPDPEDGAAPYGQYWTDHLRNLTGLTVGVHHRARTDLADYLDSADFRERPPRVLVYEVAERSLPALDPAAAPPRVVHPAIALEPLTARPLGHVPQPRRAGQDHPWFVPRFGEAAAFLSKALPRTLFGAGTDAVQERPLAYAGLFSSANATATLFHADDFLPWRADRTLLETRRRTLRAAQAAAEANGVTRFLLLVPPDKGTVYADFLAQPPPVRSAVEAVLGSDPTLRHVPLLAGLTALAAAGVPDLYKPNGSRWGTEGQLYAARAVQGTLGRLGVLAPAADAPSVATLP